MGEDGRGAERGRRIGSAQVSRWQTSQQKQAACKQRPLGASTGSVGRVEARREMRMENDPSGEGQLHRRTGDGGVWDEERGQVIDYNVTKSITGGKKRRGEPSPCGGRGQGRRDIHVPSPSTDPSSERVPAGSASTGAPGAPCWRQRQGRQGSERAGRRQGKPMRMQAAGFWAREKVGVGETSLGEVMAQ